MKRFLPLLSLSLLSTIAQADVAWQHAGDVQVGSRQVFSFNMRNEWSGDRHRTKIFADARSAARLAADMGAPTSSKMPKMGNFSIIERLDDDKFLVLVPSQNGFVEEPYSTLAERLRFDIWPPASQPLNDEVPPSLTYEQRRRLGRELRSSMRPFTSRLTRTYFRQLPNTRTIEGMECRGYRYTTLLGVGIDGPPLKVSAEWWMAAPQPGDEEVESFTKRALNLRREAGPLTLSMWANETFPILWQSMPQELHQALETMVGRPASGNYEFKGTPVQFFVTVTPPPLQQLATGQLRFRSRLTSRSTESVSPEIFSAPESYERQPLDPMLQLLQGLINEANRYSEAMLDEAIGPRANPDETDDIEIKSEEDEETMTEDTAETPVETPVEKTPEASVEATPETETETTMNTELVIEDLRVGTGATAKDGDQIVVNYRGTLLNGKQFDASYGRAPFEFTLGGGQVIQGWDKGLVGMKVGGQRKLTIPADMAYGANSPSPDIPANSTLVFEVELLDIRG